MHERRDCQAAESPGGGACSIPQIGFQALVSYGNRNAVAAIQDRATWCSGGSGGGSAFRLGGGRTSLDLTPHLPQNLAVNR